jgi:hypothetical protein
MASKKPAKPKGIDWNSSLSDFKNTLTNIAANDPIIGPNVKYAQAFVKGGTNALAKSVVKEVAVNAASYATGRVAGKVVGKVAPKVISKILPAKIGVHHSVTPTSGNPFKGKVQTSVANKGLTAMDQKPGYSYFWDTGKGKSGIAKAVSEADFQTKQIADKILLDKGQKAVGYVTKIPRGAARPDTNVPGTIARELKGTQKIVGTVKASGPDFLGMTSFSKQDINKLSRAVQVAKQKEFVKSAAKIGSLGAATTVGAIKVPKKK